MEIRAARQADVAGILEIYNDAILHTTAVYSYEPVTPEDRLAWFKMKTEQGWPVFVAEEGGVVVGFSTYGPFRPWPAYLHSVENSVYVHPQRRGQGVGKLLIPPLLEQAKAQGKRAFIAGIDSQNEVSIRLHAHFGFEQVAHFKEVGFKFGR